MKKLLLAAVAALAFSQSAMAFEFWEPPPIPWATDLDDSMSHIVLFKENILACPDLNDALETNKHDADWATAHGCFYIDISQPWVKLHGVSSRSKQTKKLIDVAECIVTKAYYDDMAKKYPDPYTSLGGPRMEVQLQMDHTCVYAVRFYS